MTILNNKMEIKLKEKNEIFGNKLMLCHFMKIASLMIHLMTNKNLFEYIIMQQTESVVFRMLHDENS